MQLTFNLGQIKKVVHWVGFAMNVTDHLAAYFTLSATSTLMHVVFHPSSVAQIHMYISALPFTRVTGLQIGPAITQSNCGRQILYRLYMECLLVNYCISRLCSIPNSVIVF